MKKAYQKPEIEVAQIFSQDTIMSSEDYVNDDSLLMDASMAAEDASGITFN